MIDWHCHLLPGLDDGARTVEEALAMARLLVAAGFSEVYCTPHAIRGIYDTTPEMVHDAVAELRSVFEAEKIPLKLHPGMEYYLDEYFPEALADPRPLGDTSLLLVEAPTQADPDLVRENIHQVVRRGFTPLFAHPERTPFLAPASAGVWGLTPLGRLLGFFSPRTSAPSGSLPPDAEILFLQGMGCRFQGNLGSFVKVYGAAVRKRAEIFHRAGLYGHFGSDGHDPAALARILSGLDIVAP